ncbi:hypothetical protein BGZ83_002364, partial [Gryganskiella cystojenkinii]
ASIHKNSLNKTNPKQAVTPTTPGAIDRRAPDSAIVPFYSEIDSGNNINNDDDGDSSTNDHINNLTVTPAAIASGDAIHLHELTAQQGVF